MRSLPELPTFRAFLPDTADLSSKFPRAGDQGRLGSCSSWAVGYAARSYYTSTVEGKVLDPASIVSPSYLFNRARPRGCDGGSSLSDNVYALKDGAVSLAQHPYIDKCETISTEEISGATEFKVQGLFRLDATRIDDVRGRLAQGEPVILALQLWPSFDDYRGGVYHVDKTSNNAEGYHAVVATGYDDHKQALRVINSWGRKWGEHGLMWLSYDAYAQMAEEAVVLRVAGFKPNPPVQPLDTSELSQLIADINTRTCANVTFRQDGKTVVVSGFVGSDDDRRRLEELASKNPDIKVVSVATAPWPQCELKQMLARATEEPEKPIISVVDQDHLSPGRLLNVTVHTPGHFSYVYISYIQADQTVVHLVQPNGPAGQTEPNRELHFGDGQQGRPKFTIAPPLGRELMVVVTSRSPLFENRLPTSQSARDYLSLLRKALIYRPRTDLPERVIAAALVDFETKATP
ncbi:MULTISPECIES: C1 family peptidase [unclassified Mesorhizobium]|nr:MULTISPECIES: C1 family peptidase [unclassified Mesorhizobium]